MEFRLGPPVASKILVFSSQPILALFFSAVSFVEANSWSALIADRYEVCIDGGLARWFDECAPTMTGRGEFDTPVHPRVLINESPEVLWPGLMLPDCLPVVGNRYGDWLCVRVGKDNQVREVLHWYHGGGDWIPWGQSIEQALLFDWVRHFLPGRRQLHAFAAEPQRRADLGDPLVLWALDLLPDALRKTIMDGGWADLPGILLEHRLATSAVHCELVLNALDTPLRSGFTLDVAERVGVRWEPDGIRWLFDHSLIPHERGFDQEFETLLAHSTTQNWQLAQSHCAVVAQERDDLGWTFDILGWAAEKVQDYQSAQYFYQKGAYASSFADQSIRFRTHWFPPDAGKFSLWRLRELQRNHQVDLSASLDFQSYLQIFEQVPPKSFASAVSAYWNRKGIEAKKRDDWSAAYEAFYRGGWDFGVERLSSYRQQLTNLVEAARNAGQVARANVAQAHLNAFGQRYGY